MIISFINMLWMHYIHKLPLLKPNLMTEDRLIGAQIFYLSESNKITHKDHSFF